MGRTSRQVAKKAIQDAFAQARTETDGNRRARLSMRENTVCTRFRFVKRDVDCSISIAADDIVYELFIRNDSGAFDAFTTSYARGLQNYPPCRHGHLRLNIVQDFSALFTALIDVPCNRGWQSALASLCGSKRAPVALAFGVQGARELERRFARISAVAGGASTDKDVLYMQPIREMERELDSVLERVR